MDLPANMSLVVTGDGSPSLIYRRSDGHTEPMHNAAGALSETRFVYETALDRALRAHSASRILSVGLGLGYNEILTIARLEREGRDAEIFSCEALPYLIDRFRAWAAGEAPTELTAVYDGIAAGAGTTRERIGAWLGDGRLRLRGSFPIEVATVECIDLVYFDAFSNKMDPHLWDESTLVDVFGRMLAPTCVLASYAAVGTLTRTLERLGFSNPERRGFRGKRNSTLAIRLAPAASP